MLGLRRTLQENTKIIDAALQTRRPDNAAFLPGGPCGDKCISRAEVDLERQSITRRGTPPK
jgi:hypothetical protein